jgi:hypothetical protein
MGDKSSQIIGARNPFALAELVERKKINWAGQSYDKSISKLENNFGMSAERIFNSKGDSPVYSQKSPVIDTVLSIGADTGEGTSVANPFWAPYGQYIKDPGTDYADPVQSGLLINCSLIASLASCAMAASVGHKAAFISQYQSKDLIDPYYFNFYDYIKGMHNIKCPCALPQYPQGSLIYGSSSTALEAWPGIIEKAYYQSRSYCLDGAVPEKPDYLRFNDEAINPTKNPAAVLYQLTGADTTNTKMVAGGAGYNADQIFNTLLGISSGVAPNQKMLYPTVAWTYAVPPDGDVWADGTIAAKHAYSILGITGVYNARTRTWTSKYIVLRNPWGPVKKDPALPAENLFTGTWNGLDLKLQDGIFALRHDLFTKYFQGFAWAAI